jgi:hypothetical protein
MKFPIGYLDDLSVFSTCCNFGGDSESSISRCISVLCGVNFSPRVRVRSGTFVYLVSTGDVQSRLPIQMCTKDFVILRLPHSLGIHFEVRTVRSNTLRSLRSPEDLFGVRIPIHCEVRVPVHCEVRIPIHYDVRMSVRCYVRTARTSHQHERPGLGKSHIRSCIPFCALPSYLLKWTEPVWACTSIIGVVKHHLSKRASQSIQREVSLPERPASFASVYPHLSWTSRRRMSAMER